MKKALLYLFVFICIQYFVSYAVWIVWYLASGVSLTEFARLFESGRVAPDVNMLVAASGLSSIVTLVIFLRRKWAVVSRNYMATRPYGVFFWCVLAAIGTIIPSVWMQEQIPEMPDILESTFNSLMSQPLGYMLIGVFAPVVEEVVFRGAILRALLGWTKSHWIAIIISAVMFSLIHFNPAQMPHAFLLGLLIGWMFYRTGSIIPGILLHFVNNTTAYIIYNLYPNASDLHLIDVLGGSQRNVFLAVVFSFHILVPALFQLHRKMKRA